MPRKHPPAHHARFANMPGECWLPALGFFGYEVSNMGRVRSRRHAKVKEGEPIPDYIAPKLLSQSPNRLGYMRVYLYRSDGKGPAKKVTKYVHTLVLEAFMGVAPQRHQCRHLSGCPSDNRLINLRWGTSRENAADKIRHGTIQRGEKHRFSKLKEDQVREIRRMAARHISYAEIAAKFNVGTSTVGRVVRRTGWAHVKD